MAITSFAALSIAAPAGPAGAAPQPFDLTLVSGDGQAFIGDNPEPLEIGDPTIIAGTADDVSGALTGVSFATPSITFSQHITDPIEAEVFITASFAEVNPGSGTGAVDGLGNVNVSSALRLNLHIEVGDPAILTGDCVSSPISLNLVSEEPYDPEAQQVTLVDGQFAIPPVGESTTCSSLLVGPVNDQLASPNNTLRLTMQGALELPPPPGDPSSVAVTSSAPATHLGHPVTFTAQVDPPTATGSVAFRNGPTTLATVPVGAGGIAEYTTSALPVGDQQITARYSGDIDLQPSVSTALAHTVTAVPSFAADLPHTIETGADPQEFTLTLANPGEGSALANLRADFQFGPIAGAGGTPGSASSGHLAPGDLVLEYHDGTTWQPIALTGDEIPNPDPGILGPDEVPVQVGSYPDANGVDLPVGQQREVTFRISAVAAARQGTLPVQVSLVTVDDDTGDIDATLATTTGTTRIVPPVHRDLNMTFTKAGGMVIPDAAGIRAGYVLELGGQLQRTPSNPQTPIRGCLSVFINDVNVPVSGVDIAGGGGGVSLCVPISTTGNWNLNVSGDITSTLAPGTHTVAVSYSGSEVFRPVQTTVRTVTVSAAPGIMYNCQFEIPGLISLVSGGNRVTAQGNLPAAAPAGSTVTASHLEVTLTSDPGASPLGMEPVGEPVLEFSPPGSVAAFSDITLAGTPTELDMPAALVDPELSIPIEGTPGEVIAVDFTRLRLDIEFFGLTGFFECAPQGTPASLGSIMVSGTTVESSAEGALVEQGVPVTLTSQVFPQTSGGVVQFFDGATSLGFAPVANGVAALTTTALPVGERSVTARYLGDLQNPVSTSEAVVVNVREVILCPGQAVEGSGAVVRATYLLLLGRCPELAGYVHWVGQLNDGLSAETFARQIASSLEAHRRSVNDGYQLILGRNADASGRAFWAQRLNSGQRYDALLGDLAASNEFWTASGSTNNGYVTRLYDRLLHRAPDTAGLNYWVGRLGAGQSRASVAAAFVRLPEPSGQIVSDAYRSILDRGPTAEERAPAVTAFQGDGHRWRIYASLIGTEEFFDRSQEFPNP